MRKGTGPIFDRCSPISAHHAKRHTQRAPVAHFQLPAFHSPRLALVHYAGVWLCQLVQLKTQSPGPNASALAALRSPLSGQLEVHAAPHRAHGSLVQVAHERLRITAASAPAAPTAATVGTAATAVAGTAAERGALEALGGAAGVTQKLCGIRGATEPLRWLPRCLGLKFCLSRRRFSPRRVVLGPTRCLNGGGRVGKLFVQKHWMRWFRA
jgi:hypothetical protein